MTFRCPVHGIPDCSPALNGCSLVIRYHELETEEILARLTPEAGWWKSSTEDVVRNAVGTMLHNGVPTAVVESVLGDLIYAIGEEYGG